MSDRLLIVCPRCDRTVTTIDDPDVLRARLAEAEAKAARLRAALVAVVGEDDPRHLEGMMAMTRALRPDETGAIEAMRVLLEIRP